MTRRSRAREVALQLLFQADQNPTPVRRKAIEAFARERLPADAPLVPFALGLYDGTRKHQPEIDPKLSATAENWRLARMTPVDRNVLRMAAYELLFDPAAEPAAVVINEGIELARRFGSADSPAFVNGILDRLGKMRSAERGTRNANPKPADTPPAPVDPGS